MKRTMWKHVLFVCVFICALSFTSIAYADESVALEQESTEVENQVVVSLVEFESIEAVVDENEGLGASEEPQKAGGSLQQDIVQEAEPSEEPDGSSDSGEPEKPVDPVEPTEPEQPSQPVQPETPSVPTEPENPSTPVEPEVPHYTQQFVKVEGKWHYFDKTGKDTGIIAVSPGWMKCEGVWYWFKSANAFAENE